MVGDLYLAQQLADAVFVVRDVEDDVGMFVDDLPSAVKARELFDLAQGAMNDLRLQLPAEAAQQVHGFQHGQEVAGLVDAGQVERIPLYARGDRAGGDLDLQRMAAIFPVGDIVMMVRKGEWGVLAGGLLFEDGCGFGLVFADDDGNLMFDDAGLFGSDRGQGIAQQVHMVVADIGDDREIGGDDIGAVEAAAETDFNDGDIDVVSRKIVEGHGDRHFEEGGIDGFPIPAGCDRQNRRQRLRRSSSR